MQVTGYVIVYTTSDAFKTEKILKKANIDVRLVPTPREFSSDCGVSAYFTCENAEMVNTLLDNVNMEYHMEGVTEI